MPLKGPDQHDSGTASREYCKVGALMEEHHYQGSSSWPYADRGGGGEGQGDCKTESKVIANG